MWKIGGTILGLAITTFASFSSSTTYQLNSYGIGPAGTNNSSSSTYTLRGSVGEQANGTISSTTYSTGTGSIYAAQLNVPPAPTLSNGSGTYYNKLLLVINNSVDPIDATYSVKVSTNNFSTYSYLQANGTLGSSPVYQSYATWGGSSGTYIVGLSSSTSYEAKVDAQEGRFSDTNYGAYATASTVAPSITFSVAPNTIALGSLLPGAVTASSSMTFGLTTNGTSGGSVYVSGLYNGLYSATQNHTIPAYSGDISSQSEGFGVQASSATQTNGGPFTISSPYNGSGTNVGAESTTPTQFIYSSAAITGGTASAVLKAIVSKTTPYASDYSETLTFIGSANF